MTASPTLREFLSGLGPATLIRRCAELPDPGLHAGDVDRTVVLTLRSLAARIQALKAEAYQLHKHCVLSSQRKLPTCCCARVSGQTAPPRC